MNPLFCLTVLSLFVSSVNAHGSITSPRSRAWMAYQEGTTGSEAGKPPIEYCATCLNLNGNVCGKNDNNNYDAWLDSTGQPMPWISQGTYVAGSTISVKLEITAWHGGHVEIKACDKGRSSDQACFDGHVLTFVEDVSHKMPADPSYPERAYLAPGDYKYEMKFQLPANFAGEEVLLQWHYVTGNTCQQPGYVEYYTGGNTDELTFPVSYWYDHVPDCDGELNNDGSRPTDYSPEQFWNCAEVTITTGTPTVPSAPVAAPTAPAPTPTAPAPTPTVPTPTASSTDCLPFGTYDEASQQCKCDGGRSPSSQQGRCRDEAGMCSIVMEWNFDALIWVCPEGSFGTGHIDGAVTAVPDSSTTQAPVVSPTGSPVSSPTQAPIASPTGVPATSTDCYYYGAYDTATQQCKCNGGPSPSSVRGNCRDSSGACTIWMEWNYASQLWVCPAGSFGTGHGDGTLPTNTNTEAPVPSPTQSPVVTSNIGPNTFQGCCSNDFKHCITWCGDSSETCGSCNLSESFGWIPLTRSQDSCKARWAGCAAGQGECCPGLSCQGPAGGWTSCVP